MNKYSYFVYDCNSDTCECVGVFKDLVSAKSRIFFLGEKFNSVRYFVIEVFNNLTERVVKTHFTTTSARNLGLDCWLHSICLDYGKRQKHNSYLELKRK